MPQSIDRLAQQWSPDDVDRVFSQLEQAQKVVDQVNADTAPKAKVGLVQSAMDFGKDLAAAGAKTASQITLQSLAEAVRPDERWMKALEVEAAKDPTLFQRRPDLKTAYDKMREQQDMSFQRMVAKGLDEEARKAGAYYTDAASDTSRQQAQELAQQDGAMAKAGYLFTHPRQLVEMGAQSLGALLPVLLATRVGAGRGLAPVANVAATGVTGGASAASQARDELRNRSEAQWASNTDYANLRANGLTHEQAADTLADRAGSTAFKVAAPLSAVAGMITAPLESAAVTGKLIAQGGIKAEATHLAQTMGKEAAEEYLQEGWAEQLGQELGQAQAGDKVDLGASLQRINEAGTVGAIAGGAMGGGLHIGGRLGSTGHAVEATPTASTLDTSGMDAREAISAIAAAPVTQVRPFDSLAPTLDEAPAQATASQPVDHVPAVYVPPLDGQVLTANEPDPVAPSRPQRIVVDGNGNAQVTDVVPPEIRQLSHANTDELIAGADGVATASQRQNAELATRLAEQAATEERASLGEQAKVVGRAPVADPPPRMSLPAPADHVLAAGQVGVGHPADVQNAQLAARLASQPDTSVEPQVAVVGRQLDGQQIKPEEPGSVPAAPSFNMRRDGTMKINGDPAQVRAYLGDIGVSDARTMRMADGVLVSVTDTPRVRAAMQQAAEKVTAPVVEDRQAMASAAEPVRRGGMSVADVEKGLADRLENVSDIVKVVQSEADLPEGLRSQSGHGGSEGVYWPGNTGRREDARVWLVANRLTNIDRANQVLSHELIGHYAMERLVDGKEFTRALNSVELMEKSGNKLIQSLAQRVDETQEELKTERPRIRTKEILAQAVETGAYKQSSTLVRVVADITRAFKAQLRKLGFKQAWVNSLSDQEVFSLLREGERRVAAGERPSGSYKANSAPPVQVAASPAFSRQQALPRRDFVLQRLEDNRHGPVYQGDGFTLKSTQHLDDAHDGDFAVNGLQMGHAAYLNEANEAYDMLAEDSDGRILATLTVQIDPQGRIAAIHDIDVPAKFRGEGIGTKIIGSIVASNPNPVDIIDMIPNAREYWRSIGVDHETTPAGDFVQNGQLDWRSFSRSVRGLKAGAPSEDVGSRGSTAEGRARSETGSSQEADDGLGTGSTNIDVQELGPDDIPPDAMFSRTKQPAPEAGFSRPTEAETAVEEKKAKLVLPEETKLDAFQRKVQDRWNRFQTLTKTIQEMGGQVGTQSDVYKAEERSHGRTATRIEDFEKKVLAPIIKDAKARGVAMEDVEEYLKVAHAKERNAQVLKVNPDNPSGSGIPDADADARMAELKKKAGFDNIKIVADQFQGLTKQRLDLLEQAGILSADQRKAYQSAYDYYVPLKNSEESGLTGTGKGMSVAGKQKRALGRSTEADDVVAHILRDYQAAIIAAEKNNVGKYLVKLIRDNKELIGDLITEDKPDSQQVFREATKASPDGSVVIQQLMPLQDNEAYVYEGGKPIRVTFRDELLAKAYTNMGKEQLNAVFQVGRDINGYLSKIYTGYNPEFTWKNLIRDATAGMLNLTSQEGIGVAAKALGYWGKTLPGLVRWSTTGNAGAWNAWVSEYRDNGGTTGASWLGNIEQVQNDLQAKLDDYEGALKLATEAAGEADRKKAWRAIKVAGRKTAGQLAHLVEHFNVASENAFRLATYRAVKETAMAKGQSEADAIANAASAAKNVTINFNRKGEIGPQLSAMYLFFNPAIQDTALLMKNLTQGAHKAQAWALIGGMAAIAARARMGWDDDDWDKVSDSTKQRNILLPILGRDANGEQRYVAIPIPYGYGWFSQLGQRVANVVRGADPKKEALHAGVAFAEGFTPTPVGAVAKTVLEGNSKNLIDTVPTSVAMVLRPAFNISTFNEQMKPDYRESQPDNEKMNRSTKGSGYDRLAQLISNNVGDKYAAEWTDVSPEVLKYWVSTLGGGTAKAVTDTIGLAMQIGGGDGNSISINDVPIARGFAGRTEVRALRGRFYELATEAQNALAAYKAAAKAGDADYIQSLSSKQMQLIRLGQMAHAYTKAGNMYYDTILQMQRDPDRTAKEKELQIRPVERAMEELYRGYLDLAKSE